MASLTRKTNCKYWIGCFTDATGKQRQRSTRLTDRLAAQRLTVTWEDLYKRRLTANQARRVIADVVKEITGENVAGETVAAFLARWAERKAAETSASTATAYKALAVGFTAHLGERARAQDFALLRASELTLQAGYPYFAIVNENETTQKGSITTPSQTTTTGSVTAAGNTAYYSGYTTTTPGSTFFYFKPSTGLLIRCFASKPDGIYVFEASFIQRSIKNKYGIN